MYLDQLKSAERETNMNEGISPVHGAFIAHKKTGSAPRSSREKMVSCYLYDGNHLKRVCKCNNCPNTGGILNFNGNEGIAFISTTLIVSSECDKLAQHTVAVASTECWVCDSGASEHIS